MAVNKVIYSGDALIDLTGDTVTADKLLAGYTAHDKSGALITGTLDPYKPEILITTNTTAVSMTVGNLSASPPAYLQPTYHEDTVWMYEVPSYGTWTVIASSMFGNITQQVVVDTVKIYRVDITATFDFSAASWSNIQYAAKNGLAADYWQVGDTRTYYDTGGTMHTVEIVDIGSNSMILDLVTPYYTGTIFTQTGPTSGYISTWPSSTFLNSLPTDFKNVVSSCGYFSQNEIFGASPLALFATEAGRSKGISWWTGTYAYQQAAPSYTYYYYYVATSGTQGQAAVNNSYYHNPKITIS